MASLPPSDSSAATMKSPGRLIGLLGLVFGLFALASPFLPGKLAFVVLGLLILVFGLLQNFAGFALRSGSESASWFSRGGSSIITGLLLIASPKLTFAGLAILLGASWFISGVSTIADALRHRDQADWNWKLIDGLVNCALGVSIAVQWPFRGIVAIGMFVGLRYLSAGWSSLMGSDHASAIDTADAHPDDRLGLPPHPYLSELRQKIDTDIGIRSRSDRAWVCLFLLTFFIIHAVRMDTDWNLIGLLSPAGAVVGDMFLSVAIAYGIVAPMLMTWRSVTRRLERRAWAWYLDRVDKGNATGLRCSAVHTWLEGRTRTAERTRQARGSATAAMGWGIRTGLPAAAILMALTPLWGVSWFYNPETWVTGAWEAWAEQRTDTWRIEMVKSVKKEYGAEAGSPDFFRVTPDGITDTKDFSFIVIGDTGEGDSSQLILRDQLMLVGQKPEVKFLVVSSDVIYPSGAMKDYEPKFYLPFKGFHQPIYALPGNHDWYDALESFTANFFEPNAARAAMRARRDVDHNLTTTTEARIDGMIKEAGFLREQYEIRAGLQHASYFEMHADQFTLVSVDTGILRRVDDDQMRWLDEALTRGGDRFKMAILGHPLYAAGHCQSEEDEDFAKLHRLLEKHRVNVVMGGDTHDFEFYKQPTSGEGKDNSMYHFVNGGGGAYLSIGTALDWPKKPATEECGYYPRRDQLSARLDSRMPIWKQPLWWWVKYLRAWPSSSETMSAAFNYDRAPFFQSFMEVRVEGSTNKVHFWLYGSNGRLRWRDLDVQDNKIPGGQSAGDLVEFTFPLRQS